MATTAVTSNNTSTATTTTTAATSTQAATNAANKANAQKILTSLGAGSGVDLSALAQNLIDAEKSQNKMQFKPKSTKILRASRVTQQFPTWYLIFKLP